MDIDVAGKLFPNITTVVVQLLATGVMLLVFKKFLWVPMQAYFEQRATFIEDSINEAKDMQSQAKEYVQESATQAKAAAVEYQQIVERAKEDAKKVREDMIEKAQKEANEKIEQATREIEAQKEATKQEMKVEIVDVALEMATKVMNQKMDNQANKTLVEDFLKEVNQ